MRPRELATTALLILLRAALISWILIAPFAWILRDGLGPDSVESHGWEALWRALSFLSWGPILLALLVANGLCHRRQAKIDWLWIGIGPILILITTGALFFRYLVGSGH